MIKATVNSKTEFTIEGKTINGVVADWDLITLSHQRLHIIKNNKSYTATPVSINAEEKTMVINVNGNDYEVSIKDKYDLLLQQLGINAKSSATVNLVKAPMPGLIINIAVKEGDEVKKGDTLLILEAMKMENVLKSPCDGKIKAIKVELRQAVDKNQLLVAFE